MGRISAAVRSWHGAGSAAAVITALFLIGCDSRLRDPDFLVWDKPGWNPKQEDTDYAECQDFARKAAYRKFYWRRSAVSRDIEEGGDKASPAAIEFKLDRIIKDEKLAAIEIAAECMESRGYRLVTINKAKR